MSDDPLGELVAVFRDKYGPMGDTAGIGQRLRRAIDDVERAVNHRWLEMLPPGALMCGCGDIVETEHQCANCDMSEQWTGDDA